MTNRDELLSMMDVTRGVRRAWIVRTSPTISDILQRYPRFADVPDAVCTMHETEVVSAQNLYLCLYSLCIGDLIFCLICCNTAIGDLCSGHWWVGYYISYSEEGPGGCGPAQSPHCSTKCNRPPINDPLYQLHII